MLDENGKCSGMILITGDVSEISSIMSNLDTGNVFERIGLTDGTSMLAVLELATAENEGSDDEAGGYLDMITYNAQVKNGRYQVGLDSFNYAGYSVEEIGIVPAMLQDYYNGSLRVLNHLQFELVFDTFCRGRYFITITRHLNRELKLMCERCHINIAITKIDVSSRSHCESEGIKGESICLGDEPGKKGEQRI